MLDELDWGAMIVKIVGFGKSRGIWAVGGRVRVLMEGTGKGRVIVPK